MSSIREEIVRAVEAGIQAKHSVTFPPGQLPVLEEMLADAGYYQLYRDAWADLTDRTRKAIELLRGF